MTKAPSHKFLILRRDNIGDLVCTTPLFSALRNQYPRALIVGLVNTYNQEVLSGHPALDQLFAYEKTKHRFNDRSRITSYVARWRLFRELRRIGFDYAILAGAGYQPYSLRLARWAGANKTVGFIEPGKRRGIDVPVAYGDGGNLHEIDDNFRLLKPLGIVGTPPRPEVVPDPAAVAEARSGLNVLGKAGPVIGMHISARKPSQRWDAERYSALGRVLVEKLGARLVLLWSPGDQSNPMHPGDDEKARRVRHGLKDIRHLAYPTESLRSLIGILSICDVFVGADGGAMHLAVGLGKPAIALFGDSSPGRWEPRSRGSVVLQATSRDVVDIPVSAVENALEQAIRSLAQ